MGESDNGLRMVEHKSIGSRIFTAVLFVILGIMALSCLYPIWYAFCVSISDKTAANSGMVTLYPVGFSTIAYREIMKDSTFFHAFGVSVLRAGFGTLFTLLILCLMAYPLSKTTKQFRLHDPIMWILLFCMVFNAGAIPWYMTMVSYRLLDSVVGLILCGSLPVFNLIIVINFFRGIPEDLEDAARVDGAGPWRVLFQIFIPVSKPVIATMVLFTSVGYWNEFFQGLVLSSSDKHYPLQTYIQQMVVNTQSVANMSPDEMKLMSALSNKSLDSAKVFIAMIPMLLIYPFIQKYFVSGMMIGAVKG